jgi:hypothetical protein
MRIALDIGGTLTKYPKILKRFVAAAQATNDFYVITDMLDRAMVLDLIERNELHWFIPPDRVLLADYAAHGEACKVVLLREHAIDVLIDDHMGYLVWPWPTPAPLRLFVMPDPRLPYVAAGWKRRESDEAFGQCAYEREMDQS